MSLAFLVLFKGQRDENIDHPAGTIHQVQLAQIGKDGQRKRRKPISKLLGNTDVAISRSYDWMEMG